MVLWGDVFKRGIVMKWLIVLVVFVAGLMAYVRLAPSDPGRWHRPIEGSDDQDFEGGVLRLSLLDIATIDRIAQNWRRTEVVAGSVAEGRITYVTRSALWGFPDYTTVEARDAGVAIYARLRFGRSDLGVNGKRVTAWLTAAQAAASR